MSTTKTKYTPSVNIIRDNTVLDNYIPTRNAIHAFNSILNDSKTGVKSHLIIGSYGTGKSSFLLAFEQTLNGKKNHLKEIKMICGKRLLEN
jgi:predicted AAA+ superfamily ATPase